MLRFRVGIYPCELRIFTQLRAGKLRGCRTHLVSNGKKNVFFGTDRHCNSHELDASGPERSSSTVKGRRVSPNQLRTSDQLGRTKKIPVLLSSR
uniref:Uncharacterized protein n=1 Tax=Cannabis sativa TaxID=3483 RepID=A0A803QXH1_CANSA